MLAISLQQETNIKYRTVISNTRKTHRDRMTFRRPTQRYLYIIARYKLFYTLKSFGLHNNVLLWIDRANHAAFVCSRSLLGFRFH